MERTSLCSRCRNLFTQPDLEPGTRDSWEYLPFRRLRRKGRSVLKSANSGCCLCRIVWNRTSAILGDVTDVKDAIIGPTIHWNGDKSAFCSLVYRVDASGSVYPELLSVALYPKTLVGDIASGHLRPLNSSEASKPMATRWLFECATQHEKCRAPDHTSTWLPTRLIDIGFSWASQTPRLILSSSISPASPAPLYISLSHRWGTANMIRLTQENLDDFKQQIPLVDLPATFRDAIQFCQDLGIRYIWIDSLCIIQDSESDWLQESSNMGKVYEYSFCNIAATSASNGGGGLYSPRDRHLITPYEVHINWKGHESPYVFFLNHHWFKSVSRAPLNGRGWVFQERLLSPRTLHFSSQLFWECRTLNACETYPSGLPSEPSILGNDIDQDFPSSTKSWREDLHQDPVGHWDLLTKMFCRCYLTQPTDRLAAIAGIASQMWPLIDDEYLAGLWRRQLPSGLLWKLENMVGQDLIITRPSRYRCPSWTWASLDFEAANVNSLDLEGVDRELAEVIDVEIESDTNQPYNNVTGGYILMLGKLGQVRRSDLPDAEWRGDRGGHYTFEVRLDVHEDSDSDQAALHCLPVLTHDRANRNPFKSLEVHCLLLQQVEQDSIAFNRMGTLQVLLDWEAETIEELRWITDFARQENPPVEELDLLMIY